jgi:S-formylglutathione hydrolase FrmB
MRAVSHSRFNCTSSIIGQRDHTPCTRAHRGGWEGDQGFGQVGLLWVGCGTGDSLFNANRAFSEQLTEAGVEHTFRVTLGGHTMGVWQRYLHEVVPLLF